jgi:hypothetical protein
MNDTLADKNYPVNIIQVRVTYDDLTYYAAYPVLLSFVRNNTYRIKLRKNSGFKQVVYQ